MEKSLRAVLVSLTLAFVGILVGTGENGYPNSAVKPMKLFLAEHVNATVELSRNSSAFEFLWSSFAGLQVGCTPVALLCVPYVADTYGRKMGFLIFLIPALLGRMLQIIAAHIGSWTWLVLFLGRLLSLFSASALVALCPVIISEICPMSIRGLCGSFQALAMALGLTISVIMGLPSVFGSNDYWHIAYYIFLFLSLPGIPLIWYMKDTPIAILVRTGKSDEGKTATETSLKFYRGSTDDYSSIVKDAASFSEKQGFARKIINLIKQRGLRFPTLIATCVGITYVFPQFQLILYSTSLFVYAGLDYETSNYATLALNVMSLLLLVLSMFTADKIKRRPLLLVCVFVQTACFFVMAVCQQILEHHPVQHREILTYVISACMFVLLAALSMGPRVLFWILVPEMFPYSYRTTGKSFTILVVMVVFFPFVVSQTVMLHNRLGGLLYCLHGIISLICSIVAYKYLLETKGLEMDQVFGLYMEKYNRRIRPETKA